MPLHLLQSLPGGVTLGLWHLTEPAAALWPQLAHAPTYASLLPARADGPRQAQWLAGRVLVQQLLAQHAAGQALAQLCNDAYGRPWLSGPGPQPAVSLSHAGEWVAALLGPSGAAVGIDVEAVREKARRIAPKFLSAAEQAAVAALCAPGAAFVAAPDALYSLLWSVKETLYKLAGQRGIIFRRQLLLELCPAAGLWPASGELPAQLVLPSGNSRHQICYTSPAAGYVLTYCVQVQH